MRIACSLGSLLSVNQVLECSKIISSTNIDSIWIPETWGMENFSMLSAVSGKTFYVECSIWKNTHSKNRLLDN